jgi:hypothetical protein
MTSPLVSRGCVAGVLALAAAAACAQVDVTDRSAWRFVSLPNKVPTQFDVVDVDGAPALRITAAGAYGNLVRELPQGSASGTLRWQWRVDRLNERADLTRRDGDDTTMKVCALFDLPMEAVPVIERQVLRLMRSKTGEALPAAAVCYVWDAHLAQGTSLDNAFTRRMRYIVLRGAGAPLQRWVEESRDLVADFLRLFGDEAKGQVPPLVALTVGADSDNTRETSVGAVRELHLAPAPR